MAMAELQKSDKSKVSIQLRPRAPRFHGFKASTGKETMVEWLAVWGVKWIERENIRLYEADFT